MANSAREKLGPERSVVHFFQLRSESASQVWSLLSCF